MNSLMVFCGLLLLMVASAWWLRLRQQQRRRTLQKRGCASCSSVFSSR